MTSENRSSFVVRLSPTLHRSLKSWAEESGMSLNTLAVSILQWASDHGHPGEPVYEQLGASSSSLGVEVVRTQNEPEYGTAWVGRAVEEVLDDETGQFIEIDEGEVYFLIDDRAQSRVRIPDSRGGQS